MKSWKKISVAVLTGVLAVGPVATIAPKEQIVTQAAEAYTYKTVKNNQTFKGEGCTITVKNYYKHVVLSGSSSAVKSINKQLKKYSDAFMAEPSGAVEYAKDDCKYRTYDETYNDYVTQKVSYLSDGIVSIVTTWTWYAGGVGNTNIYGYTFDLKTGKEIKKLTSVTKTTSLTKIKSTLTKKIEADPNNFDPSDLKDMKATDFHFYINSKGKVVVCFGPYELGWGGWTKKYTLSGRYES